MSAQDALSAYMAASGKAWKTFLDYRELRATEAQVAEANKAEANALAELQLLIDGLDGHLHDHHCATCQCAGTECRENEWCKRTWGHRGSCSVIRDEEFSR